jgi:hypothetical protein
MGHAIRAGSQRGNLSICFVGGLRGRRMRRTLRARPCDTDSKHQLYLLEFVCHLRGWYGVCRPSESIAVLVVDEWQ